MKQCAILLVVLTLSVLPGAGVSVADAVPTPLTLVGPIQSDILGPQSTSNPCIIAATQCQQPAWMGFNQFASDGNTPTYNMSAPIPRRPSPMESGGLRTP